MICIFLMKGFLLWWNGVIEVGWFVFFLVGDCHSGGIDSRILDDSYFSEGIATVVELSYWLWMICVFLNKGLLQWWNWLTYFRLFVFFLIRDCRSGGIDSLMVKDLFFLKRRLPEWWNWLIAGGWFVFFWLRDCHSGGMVSLILEDLYFSEYGIAAVVEWTQLF